MEALMAPKQTSKITEKEWLEDFNDFVSHKDASVPEELSQKIFSYVHRDLNPSPSKVFVKLTVIHALVGTLSLSICDQFGMNPFNRSFSLSEYFMRFGHSVCMSLCGFLFLSLSVLIAWFFLRPEELQRLWKTSWIQIPSIAMLSLAAFAALGADLFVGIAGLWFLGAVIGGLLTTYLVSRALIPRHA